MADQDQKRSAGTGETEDGVEKDQSLNSTDQNTSGGDETKDADAAQSKKKERDCREHCMHCGNHCIYLK